MAPGKRPRHVNSGDQAVSAALAARDVSFDVRRVERARLDGLGPSGDLPADTVADHWCRVAMMTYRGGPDRDTRALVLAAEGYPCEALRPAILAAIGNEQPAPIVTPAGMRGMSDTEAAAVAALTVTDDLPRSLIKHTRAGNDSPLVFHAVMSDLAMLAAGATNYVDTAGNTSPVDWGEIDDTMGAPRGTAERVATTESLVTVVESASLIELCRMVRIVTITWHWFLCDMTTRDRLAQAARTAALLLRAKQQHPAIALLFDSPALTTLLPP